MNPLLEWLDTLDDYFIRTYQLAPYAQSTLGAEAEEGYMLI